MVKYYVVSEKVYRHGIYGKDKVMKFGKKHVGWSSLFKPVKYSSIICNFYNVVESDRGREGAWEGRDNVLISLDNCVYPTNF